MNGAVLRGMITVVWAAAAVAGLALAVVGRGNVHLFGDEFHSIWNVHRPYRELIGLYDGFGSGVALPLLQRLMTDLLATSDRALAAGVL